MQQSASGLSTSSMNAYTATSGSNCPNGQSFKPAKSFSKSNLVPIMIMPGSLKLAACQHLAAAATQMQQRSSLSVVGRTGLAGVTVSAKTPSCQGQ
jgi:hypothetical protein